MTESISPGARILLAEDYEPNAQLLMTALELEAYEVDLAINGRIAIDMAQAADYAAIIMDIEMPEVDGIAATQAIREQEQAANRSPVPILGISGHNMTSIRTLCMKAGMNELIVKPFLPSVLYDHLAVLISPAGPAQAAAT